MNISNGQLTNVLTLAFTLTLTAQAALALSRGEDSIVGSWKRKAAGTTMGAALILVLNDCNRGIAINSQNGKAYFRRGYLYGIIGCTASALEDLTTAVSTSPYDSRALAERGLCYMDLKQYNMALPDFNRALQLDPRSGTALFNRARLWLLIGKPAQALADLEACQGAQVKFVAELPGEYPANQFNAVAYYTGTAWEALARPDKAIGCYKDCLKASDQQASGYLHRYAEQPADAQARLAKLEHKKGGI